MGSVNYELHLRSASQEGFVRAKGFINLPLAGQPFLETLISRSELEVSELELADFLDLAASRSNVPRGRGVLNATFHLNAAGIEDFEISGETSLRGVQLTGGMLGEEHPLLDRLDFTFKGSHRREEGWRLSTLDLQSEQIRLTASGSLDRQAVSLVAKGSVNLPAIAAQTPRLLGLHQKTTITEGTADFSFDVMGGTEALAIRADCRTDRLRLVHQDREYWWNSPLDLLAEVDYSQEKMVFRTLRVLTPFIEARGSGGLDDFTLQADGDFDLMSQELGKIFALNVHAKGRAALLASSRKREDGGFGLETRISIDDFTLSRGQASLLPAHDFILTGKIDAAPSFVRDGALRSLQIDADSWPAQITIRAEDMQRSAGQAENNCSLKGTVDLSRLSRVARGLSDAFSSSDVKGVLKFDGAGRCEGRQIAVQSLNGTVEPLAVVGAAYTLHEPRVVFGLGGTQRLDGRTVAVGDLLVAENWQDFGAIKQPRFLIDGDRHRLEVRNLECSSARASLAADLLIEDWRQPAAGYSAAIRGETDGALLADLGRRAGWFPSDLTVKGRARAALATVSGQRHEARTDVSVQMEKFALLRGKKELFVDPRPILRVSLLSGGQDTKTVTIPSFFLHTDPLRIEGAGLVARNDPPTLELQGRMTPDFALVTPFLTPVIGRELFVTGNRAGDFLLSLPLAWPAKAEQLTFTAQLPLDSLRFQGIKLQQLTLPVDLNRGKLRFSIDQKLNDGRIALYSLWDLAAPKPLLTLPPATQLLKDVALKPPLVNSLGRIHPLFGILAQPRGTVDLRLDSFSVPMTAQGPQQPVFTAIIALDRIKFKATDVLRTMLDLDGFDQEWFRCKERELICEGKNGRVSCAPVHLLAGKVEIGLRGYGDKDGSLHYRVQMPVGKQLADKAQLIVQTEATVEAEIRGTRDQPIFDQAAFLTGLANQLRKGIELNAPEMEAFPQPAPATENSAPVEQTQ
jgi:hypothetical protein